MPASPGSCLLFKIGVIYDSAFIRIKHRATALLPLIFLSEGNSVSIPLGIDGVHKIAAASGKKISMSVNSENLSSLQTGSFRRLSANQPADKLLGLETLDLSVAEPAPTAHFKPGRSNGAWFQKKSKELPYGNAWQLSEQENSLKLELRLPKKHGVVLILEMCRTAYDSQSDEPAIINVNGEEWPLKLDARYLKYYKQSWYLPHYYLHEGKNNISLRRASEVVTEVLVKSVAVMRFEVEKQRRGNWCWAAVTNSLLSFFKPEHEMTQCDIVRECFSATKGFETAEDCCQHSKHEECNRTFKLVDALDLMGVLSSRCNYPLSLDEIREQLNEGVPIGVRIGWRGGGGHFVVITAIGPPDPKGDSHTWIRVADPKDPAAAYITYRTLKNRYKGEGKWTHSYLFEKERKRHQ